METVVNPFFVIMVKLLSNFTERLCENNKKCTKNSVT